MTLSLFETLAHGPIVPLARPAAALLREAPDRVAVAIEDLLRLLVVFAGQQAESPFATAEMFRAAVGDPFDREPLEDTAAAYRGGVVTDRLLAAGAEQAVKLLGIQAMSRLATAAAPVWGLAPASVVRLPGMVVPLLFDALRQAVERDGLDQAGLAALLMSEADIVRQAPIDSRMTQALGLLRPAANPGGSIGS
jgi:hypothetical protein